MHNRRHESIPNQKIEEQVQEGTLCAACNLNNTEEQFLGMPICKACHATAEYIYQDIFNLTLCSIIRNTPSKTIDRRLLLDTTTCHCDQLVGSHLMDLMFDEDGYCIAELTSQIRQLSLTSPTDEADTESLI